MIYTFLLVLSIWACRDMPDMEPIVIETEDPADNEVTLKFLALGDSYTIGQSVEEEYRWPNILQDSLEAAGMNYLEPQIIATTGWRTDQLYSAATSQATENDYDLVSLLIGVNNQYQGRSVEDYRPEFEQLLQFAITKVGGDTSRVFVLSIPDYGCTPFGASRAEEIARAIDEFNAANKEITDSYNVAYFNITGISREGKDDPSLVASDGLHPSGKQYVRWVQKILSDQEFIDRLNQ